MIFSLIRQSITYDDEEAYYTSKEVPGPYGSITAIKNRYISILWQPKLNA